MSGSGASGGSRKTSSAGSEAAIDDEPVNLDPRDWAEFRALAHAALDDALDGISTVREGPAWREPSAAARRAFDTPLPIEPTPFADALTIVKEAVSPYATGNRHPRFMGWVHGAGTAHGAIAEMIAASLNMNCGGRNHIGIDVEAQIVTWMAEVMGFPKSSSGIFLTGSSMANFLAVIIARTAALGRDCRETGVTTADGARLVGYTSAEAHGCVRQAFELAGLGSARLRNIETDHQFRLSPDALAAAIDRDIAAGLRPFICIATAGTVNTGAFDPLSAIASLTERHGIWLHVDGAIGALAALSQQLKPRLDGISSAQSIAMDFHKSAHVPYDAGFLLVKDRYKHLLAFAADAHYLRRSERGAAAGETWPADLGPDLSRGFRALKTWLTLKVFGLNEIGRAIERSVVLARAFAAKIQESSEFELKAPAEYNIVCFGLKGRGHGLLNREIAIDLQVSGVAVPSWTEIDGETVIRAAFINHRTNLEDLDMTIAAASDAARRIAKERHSKV